MAILARWMWVIEWPPLDLLLVQITRANFKPYPWIWWLVKEACMFCNLTRSRGLVHGGREFSLPPLDFEWLIICLESCMKAIFLFWKLILLLKNFPYTNSIHWQKKWLASHTSWGKPWHVCSFPHGGGVIIEIFDAWGYGRRPMNQD